MTSKIEVPRELLQFALNAVEYLALRADDIGSSNAPVADALRQLLAAPESPRQEPVMKLEAERLWDGAGEYAISFVKSGWLDECRKSGGTFMLYAAPLSPDHSGGAGKVVLPDEKDESGGQTDDEYYKAIGWNACLDKVKELNQ